jgi:hypothetical protein
LDVTPSWQQFDDFWQIPTVAPLSQIDPAYARVNHLQRMIALCTAAQTLPLTNESARELLYGLEMRLATDVAGPADVHFLFEYKILRHGNRLKNTKLLDLIFDTVYRHDQKTIASAKQAVALPGFHGLDLRWWWISNYGFSRGVQMRVLQKVYYDFDNDSIQNGLWRPVGLSTDVRPRTPEDIALPSSPDPSSSEYDELRRHWMNLQREEYYGDRKEEWTRMPVEGLLLKLKEKAVEELQKTRPTEEDEVDRILKGVIPESMVSFNRTSGLTPPLSRIGFGPSPFAPSPVTDTSTPASSPSLTEAPIQLDPRARIKPGPGLPVRQVYGPRARTKAERMLPRDIRPQPGAPPRAKRGPSETIAPPKVYKESTPSGGSSASDGSGTAHRRVFRTAGGIGRGYMYDVMSRYGRQESEWTSEDDDPGQ